MVATTLKATIMDASEGMGVEKGVSEISVSQEMHGMGVDTVDIMEVFCFVLVNCENLLRCLASYMVERI